MSNILLTALQNPALYPHPVKRFETIETHLSWVLLTGDYAYKIKKPLNLGFQDFTTLEKRKHYCELEVALNKRLAPDIYIEVLAITGSENNPTLNGTGGVIEYAVKMNQFDQHALLSNVVKQNKLNAAIVEDIAKQTAQFHQGAQICDASSDFGSAQVVYEPIKDNFTALKTLPASKQYMGELIQIETFVAKKYLNLEPLLTSRKQNGYIRATHGDFHLGNMVLIKDKPVIFDCIEFNESFRFTDVMNDVCFLAMDFDRHHLKALGNLFVNNYFEHTFDYDGARLLSFYKSYRAMVRAKISALQLNQVTPGSDFAQKLALDLKEFLRLGLDYSQEKQPALSITYGLSGSGKSLYSKRLMMEQGSIQLRADVFRKHLFNQAVFESTPKDKQATLYAPSATEKVYHTLLETSKSLLKSGLSVIVDATFLKMAHRNAFRQLAHELNLPFTIYAFDAPIEVLQDRINLRKKHTHDPSDATNEVLGLQLSQQEALSDAEKKMAIVVSASEIDKIIRDSSSNL